MKWTAALLLALAVIASRRIARRDSMSKQKPRAEDRMSYRWRVESAYSRTGDES